MPKKQLPKKIKIDLKIDEKQDNPMLREGLSSEAVGYNQKENKIDGGRKDRKME